MYPLKIKEKYDGENLAQLSFRFSTAYLGNYIPGDTREYVGSHVGVDMVPTQVGQDVLSIFDGKVIKAAQDGAYGNFVVIEHQNLPHPDNFSQTTTLYSCYLHLSELHVEVNQVLKEGDVIGKTGNTGNSYGEHLHFQIDRKEAPFHPYWPYSLADIKKANCTFTQGVDLALGFDNAKMYTINPLVYIDAVASGKMPEKKNIVAPDTASGKNSEDEKDFFFNDLNKDDPYYPYVIELAKKGYIKGFPDNMFFPKNSITRGEFLKLILLVKGINISTDNKDYFQDILSTSWQKKYVNTAVNIGLVSTKNQNFAPNNFLSRVEALKMILILFVGEISLSYAGAFSDVKESDWFAKYVQYAQDKNLISYDEKFYPSKEITRMEIVKILYKLKK